jgi:hypothetical protein
MRNRRGLLQLEGLTERIVPAVSIRSVDGDLVISGIANTDGGLQKLWVNVTADNQVTIQDGGSAFGTGGKSRGVYAVTGDLIFNLSNRSDSVTIDFTGAFTLDGDITANMRNGNDTLTITNSGNDDSGIFGSLTVDGGNGTDTLSVTNTGTTSTMTIQGGLSFNGGAGVDVASINDTGAVDVLEIGSGLTLTRVNTVNVGTVGDVEISGNVTINAASDRLVTNAFNIGDTGTAVGIAGTLVLTGGQGTDTVAIENVSLVDVIPAEDEVLEITINLDRGVNNSTFTAIQFGVNGTDADFAYTGGTGVDNVDFVGTNTVSGDAVFTFGNGSNSLEISDTTTFDADVTVSGGKVDDTVDLNNATINGLLTLTMGNGENGFATGTTAVIDGGLTYTGGSGKDTVTLNNGDGLAGDVSISVGAGDDEIVIDNTNVVAVTSLTVDLGIDGDPDIFDYDAILNSLITILNQGSDDTVTPV